VHYCIIKWNSTRWLPWSFQTWRWCSCYFGEKHTLMSPEWSEIWTMFALQMNTIPHHVWRLLLLTVKFIETRTPPVEDAMIPITTPSQPVCSVNTRTSTAQRLLLAGWHHSVCRVDTLSTTPTINGQLASPLQTLVVLIIVMIPQGSSCYLQFSWKTCVLKTVCELKWLFSTFTHVEIYRVLICITVAAAILEIKTSCMSVRSEQDDKMKLVSHNNDVVENSIKN